jgi:hypothetical protein
MYTSCVLYHGVGVKMDPVTVDKVISSEKGKDLLVIRGYKFRFLAHSQSTLKDTITICHIVHVASLWSAVWEPVTCKAKTQNKLLNSCTVLVIVQSGTVFISPMWRLYFWKIWALLPLTLNGSLVVVQWLHIPDGNIPILSVSPTFNYHTRH